MLSQYSFDLFPGSNKSGRLILLGPTPKKIRCIFDLMAHRFFAGNKNLWIKLRACEKILDFYLREIEMEALVKRVEALEAETK